jgi:hypothetical protein
MATVTSNLLKHFRFQSPYIKKVFEEYKKPILSNAFFNNIDMLIENSELIKFDRNEWNYRPDIFCNDYYDEPYLYPIILTVNNIPTIFQFIPENFLENIILAPTMMIILKLIETL